MGPALSRIATRQGGVFTYDQAIATHCPAQIRSNLRRRVWRRTPWRGLFVDAELPDDVPTLVRAAALLLGGDLVACHTTAALLWGFDLRSRQAAIADDLHFLGPPDLDNRRLAGLRVHPSSLGTDDAVCRQGVWCTPPARTACEVGRLGAPIDLLATLDAALASRTCSPGQLAAACAQQRGLRGVVLLGELLPMPTAEPSRRWSRGRAGGSSTVDCPRPRCSCGSATAGGGTGWTWAGRSTDSASSSTDSRRT